MKFKKVTEEQVYDTCFSHIVFVATTNQIIDIFGEPSYRGDASGKVTREWWMQTENGDAFTVYDWKMYCDYDDEEAIEWHVGTKYGIPDEKESKDRVRTALKEAGLC